MICDLRPLLVRVYIQLCVMSMPDMFICVPEDYYSSKMQNFIKLNCTDPAKQWIYNVILDKPAASEIVLHRDKDWTLCRDGNMSDGKWLVVLHDMSLKSLRDLRGKHVGMLHSIQSTVNTILSNHYSIDRLKSDFFIHYFPSVFQLHIHVHLRDKRLTSVHDTLQSSHGINVSLGEAQATEPLPKRQSTRVKQRVTQRVKQRDKRKAKTGPVHDCSGGDNDSYNQPGCKHSTVKHCTDDYSTGDCSEEAGVEMQARHGLCLSSAAQMFTSGRHSRRHSLHHIVRNLVHNDLHYATCIMFANMCRTARASGVYTSIRWKSHT